MLSQIKAALQSAFQSSGFEVRRASTSDGSKGRMVLARIPSRLWENPVDRAALRRMFRKRKASRKVLLVTHKGQQCGVHQYGVNIAAALAKSKQYEFVHVISGSMNELNRAVLAHNPTAIIYNYIGQAMPWLGNKATRAYGVVELGIMHEVTQADADSADSSFFDFHICPDPTLKTANPLIFITPRIIPSYTNTQPLPSIPTFGSFGFGFSDKGFERLIETVEAEYDEARIVLRMPFNDISDKTGAEHALRTAERCRATVTKPGIQLEINHNFLSKPELLDWLASNTLNAFFYTISHARGISSTVEHALAVDRPLAVSHCNMFRHVHDAKPSICIEDSSLREIVANGTAPLKPYQAAWTEERFIECYEAMVEKVSTR